MLRHIIVAPHIESISGEGGLDELFLSIAAASAKKGIPMTYALNRNKLGKAVGKKMKVSMIGIIDYGGASESFSLIKNLSVALKERWQMRQADRLYDMEYLCEYDKEDKEEKKSTTTPSKLKIQNSAHGWSGAKIEKKKSVFNLSAKAFVPVQFYAPGAQPIASTNPYSTAKQDLPYGMAGGGTLWSGNSGYISHAEPLPGGWYIEYAPLDGTPYYVNSATGESQFQRPSSYAHK